MSEEQDTITRRRVRLPSYFPTLVLAGSIVVSAILLSAVSWIQIVSSSTPNYLIVPGFDEQDSEFDRLWMYQVHGVSYKARFIDVLRCFGTDDGDYQERFLNARFHVKYEGGAGVVDGVAHYVNDKCVFSKKRLDNLSIDVVYSIRVLGVRIHKTHKVVTVKPETRKMGSESTDDV